MRWSILALALLTGDGMVRKFISNEAAQQQAGAAQTWVDGDNAPGGIGYYKQNWNYTLGTIPGGWRTAGTDAANTAQRPYSINGEFTTDPTYDAAAGGWYYTPNADQTMNPIDYSYKSDWQDTIGGLFPLVGAAMGAYGAYSGAAAGAGRAISGFDYADPSTWGGGSQSLSGQSFSYGNAPGIGGQTMYTAGGGMDNIFGNDLESGMQYNPQNNYYPGQDTSGAVNLGAGDPYNGVTGDYGAPKGIPMPDGSTMYATAAQAMKLVQQGSLAKTVYDQFFGNAGAQQGSPASRLINQFLGNQPGSSGYGTVSDLTSLLGGLGAAGLGAYGSSQQTDLYKQLAQQAQGRWDQSLARYDQSYADSQSRYKEAVGMGAPYRERLSGLYNDPSSFLSSAQVQQPVQQGSDILARSLSVNGNPAGSGNALQQLQNYSSNALYGKLGEEETRLGNLGGLSSFNSAAGQGTPLYNLSGAAQGPNTSAATAAIGQTGNTYANLGAGANNLFNPTPKFNLQDFMKQFGGG